METKIISSNRGKPVLVFDNFKFSFTKDIKSTSEKFWRCTNRQCKATVHTLGSSNDIVITKHPGEHNHEANLASLTRQVVSAACKRKATEDLAEKPMKIIRQELQRDLPSNLTTRDVQYIRHNMYNSRRRTLPTLPKNMNEVHIALSSLNVVTSRNEDFVLINNERDNIIIFSCDTNINIVKDVSRIYMDGTFTYCTKFFCQFFTIHGFVNGRYIPLIYCLLPSKSAEIYTKLFQLVIGACLSKGIDLNIKEVVVDFEKAIHLAILNTWPNAKIVGCRFHLSQAWYRKIQTCGLVPEYKHEASEIGKWLKLTFALMYLDPTEVGDCFALELFENMPQDPRLVKYADYLVDTYISEESLFPPIIWAEHSSTITRTTNACESFHSNFKNSIYAEHPNLFVFVEKLKEFQTDTYIKIQSLQKPIQIHDMKVKKRQKFIESMIIKHQNKEINRLHFIKCLSFHCYVNK